MIENTGATIDHFVESWTRQIVKYAKRYKDNMTSRNVMEVRSVGPSVAIDVVTSYDRTGPGAQVLAKGAVPKSMSVTKTDTPHEIYQIGLGFNISEKDLKLDPERHARTIDVALREIHRKEDDMFLNGIPKINLSGLVDTARANSNGKIVAAGATGNDTNNKGAWSGEADTDIYDDLLTADGKIDEEFDMARLVGVKADLRYLWRLDSLRNPYRKLSAPLFGKNEADVSWMWKTGHLDNDYVYACAKDFEAGELIVSENPSIATLYNGGLGQGRNYYFEISEWVVPEFHNADGYVEIQIT